MQLSVNTVSDAVYSLHYPLLLYLHIYLTLYAHYRNALHLLNQDPDTDDDSLVDFEEFANANKVQKCTPAKKQGVCISLYDHNQ
jgi:hypothetical protein